MKTDDQNVQWLKSRFADFLEKLGAGEAFKELKKKT